MIASTSPDARSVSRAGTTVPPAVSCAVRSTGLSGEPKGGMCRLERVLQRRGQHRDVEAAGRARVGEPHPGAAGGGDDADPAAGRSGRVPSRRTLAIACTTSISSSESPASSTP